VIGIHYLGDAQIQSMRPAVTFFYCHIWRVRRTDGVVHRFASHDKVVWWQGERYEPVGPTASDLEQSEAGAESDFELVGFLSADTIRASDIQAGRYDGCRVDHRELGEAVGEIGEVGLHHASATAAARGRAASGGGGPGRHRHAFPLRSVTAAALRAGSSRACVTQ
jgi:hypothetical protein